MLHNNCFYSNNFDDFYFIWNYLYTKAPQRCNRVDFEMCPINEKNGIDSLRYDCHPQFYTFPFIALILFSSFWWPFTSLVSRLRLTKERTKESIEMNRDRVIYSGQFRPAPFLPYPIFFSFLLRSLKM
jgi:hypothetical protein